MVFLSRLERWAQRGTHHVLLSCTPRLRKEQLWGVMEEATGGCGHRLITAPSPQDAWVMLQGGLGSRSLLTSGGSQSPCLTVK